ncbi:MAG: antitoxin VapB family protein [Nitrososphaerota archaeon]|nr:antitoxin VapB family protein [Nitrososphaerota archaeon]
MGTKTISISDEAYSRLAARKRTNESFTDVINRLTEKKSILELAGVLTASEAKEVRSNIRRVRKENARRLARLVERMY